MPPEAQQVQAACTRQEAEGKAEGSNDVTGGWSVLVLKQPARFPSARANLPYSGLRFWLAQGGPSIGYGGFAQRVVQCGGLLPPKVAQQGCSNCQATGQGDVQWAKLAVV